VVYRTLCLGRLGLPHIASFAPPYLFSGYKLRPYNFAGITPILCGPWLLLRSIYDKFYLTVGTQ